MIMHVQTPKGVRALGFHRPHIKMQTCKHQRGYKYKEAGVSFDASTEISDRRKKI